MVKAFLTVNTIPDKMEQVLRDMRKIKGVEQAHMVYGLYDIILEVLADNIDELRSLILKIRKNPDVFHLLVQLVQQKEKIDEYTVSVSNTDYSGVPKLNI
ncbi:MAG: Lrp/AsnC ligand binding domain-containing protein [Candidatus Bathyarchaeota archaeon]